MKYFLLFVTICLCGHLYSKETARGTVFSDLNHNQVMDNTETGIENVMVSNGSDIVKTDQDGNYEIEVEEGQILFIIKPSKWKTPIDQNNLPRFYYIHKPEGSPQLKYKGSSPTGKLPAQINFPLYRQEEDENFEAYIFGDPQPSNPKEVQFLAMDVLSEVAGDTIRKFGISLGDIVSNNLEDYDLVKNAFAHVGLPWYNVIGNHDLNFDLKDDLLSDETFEAHYGPATFAFQYAKTHFIILDNVVYTGEGKRKYIGGFREDQFDFVENYLSLIPKDEWVILSMHIPLFQRLTSYYKDVISFRPEDREKLFQLLKDHPNTLSFSAHTHFQKQHFFTKEEGWMQEKPHQHINLGTACGDWFKGLTTVDGYPDATMRDGTPNGYAILKMYENKASVQYKVSGGPADKQISLSLDTNTIAEYVYANFYMGNTFSRLFCEFDQNNEWLEMEHVYENDPRTVVMYKNIEKLDNKIPGRQISAPHPCSHLWKVNIPNDLTKGFHLVKVRAVDMSGQVFTEKMVFRHE
jgi:hypothetical protein